MTVLGLLFLFDSLFPSGSKERNLRLIDSIVEEIYKNHKVIEDTFNDEFKIKEVRAVVVDDQHEEVKKLDTLINQWI